MTPRDLAVAVLVLPRFVLEFLACGGLGLDDVDSFFQLGGCQGAIRRHEVWAEPTTIFRVSPSLRLHLTNLHFEN